MTVDPSKSPRGVKLLTLPVQATLCGRSEYEWCLCVGRVCRRGCKGQTSGYRGDGQTRERDGHNHFRCKRAFIGPPIFAEFASPPLFFGNPEQRSPQDHSVEMALGSGFFISADGYAVTNAHVVQHGVSFEIATDDGRTATAKVIGADLRTDVALLKVDGRNDFPYVRFADKEPRVGDWVIAVGNPYGLGGTVTAGIVSACGRRLGVDTYDDFIQIDAPMRSGRISTSNPLGENQKLASLSLAAVVACCSDCRSEDIRNL